MFCQTSTRPFTVALADGSSGHTGVRVGHTVASDDRANRTAVPVLLLGKVKDVPLGQVYNHISARDQIVAHGLVRDSIQTR